MFMGNEVDEAGVLAPNSKTLIPKELCDLFTCLEAASLGSDKTIACLLTGEGYEEQNQEGREGSQDQRQEE